MKENTIFLQGQISGKPKVFANTEGVPVKAKFTLRVIRRLKTTNGMGEERIRIDYAFIITENTEMIKEILNFCEGDIIELKGVFTTHNVRKKSVCPCGHINIKQGVFNFVTPIYISRREQGLSDVEGYQLLLERNEVSNNIFTIGTLVSDVMYYDDGVINYSQYQLVLGRKYWIKTDPADLKVDFPFVRSYGVLGKRDNENLHKGSHVFIAGALQTRTYDRKAECEKCHETYTFEDSAMEISPYSVEYLDVNDNEEDNLDNYKFEEETD